jgi:hypothetical protein
MQQTSAARGTFDVTLRAAADAVSRGLRAMGDDFTAHRLRTERLSHLDVSQLLAEIQGVAVVASSPFNLACDCLVRAGNILLGESAPMEDHSGVSDALSVALECNGAAVALRFAPITWSDQDDETIELLRSGASMI